MDISRGSLYKCLTDVQHIPFFCDFFLILFFISLDAVEYGEIVSNDFPETTKGYSLTKKLDTVNGLQILKLLYVSIKIYKSKFISQNKLSFFFNLKFQFHK